MDKNTFTILGQTVRQTIRKLETFSKPEGVTTITMISDEVTSLCPVTGQPDLYTISIIYKPETQCLESKSCKLYLQSFRNEGIFCEAFAARICEDVLTACHPSWCKVEVKQKARGGIEITAIAELYG